MKSAICAISRNENNYLEEWITYHLHLGFNHIFIYDNNNPDDNSTPRFCSIQSWKEQVTVIDYRGKLAAQLIAYNDCYTTHSKEFDWIAFIDIDEFITFGPKSAYTHINNYLSSITNFDVVAINWMFYGDNEEVNFKKGSVIQRFPHPISNSGQNKHVKVIVRTRMDIRFIRNPHCVDGKVRICDDCQQRVKKSTPFKAPSFKKLYIRHYGTKSIEEFITNKILRGAADQGSNPYKLDLFYQTNKRSKEKHGVEQKYFHVHRPVENPLVSVIIPNYNHKKYLKQRIDSVLSQTFTNFEVILLDDCSTDNSQQLLLSYKDHPHVSYIFLSTKNSGSPFFQWEKGIRLAKGKYIWIAESDDCASPDFLSATVEQLKLHPDAQLCITGSYVIDGDNNPVQTNEFDHWEEDGKSYLFQSESYLTPRMFEINSVYNASMVLFRKAGCISNISSHYREMRYCGDWLFWLEQICKGNIIEIHQKLNYFRKHTTNTTYEGIQNGNALGEIAFIRNWFYTQIFQDSLAILQDKYNFYRMIKRFPISTHRQRRKVLKEIAKEGNITYWHYQKWRLYKMYTKHVKPLLEGQINK